MCGTTTQAIGKPHKRKIIGRRMGYHGSTSASISASGKPDMHADFGLPFPDFRHTEFPHYYRLHEDGESEEQFATRMADALETLIVAEGPDTIGALHRRAGDGRRRRHRPARTYLEKIQAVLRKYDVLFIADEVICGFGRTGNMWGSQTFDLQPDMISSAKALSAGNAADLGAADQSARVRGDAGRKPQTGQSLRTASPMRAIR